MRQCSSTSKLRMAWNCRFRTLFLSPPARDGEGGKPFWLPLWADVADVGDLWADVTDWSGETSTHDDMTLLVARVPSTAD